MADDSTKSADATAVAPVAPISQQQQPQSAEATAVAPVAQISQQQQPQSAEATAVAPVPVMAQQPQPQAGQATAMAPVTMVAQQPQPGQAPVAGQPYVVGQVPGQQGVPQTVYYGANQQAVQMQPGPPGQQVVYGQPGQPVQYVQPGGQYMQPGMAPMMQPGQQQQVQWMAKPDAPAGCPPGLEYLTQVDQLLVQQQIELLELITGFETQNKYRIFNNMGQQCYFAAEESSVAMRMCCGPGREFTMHITDNMNNEIIRVYRPFKCCVMGGCCGCCEACQHEVHIESPPGNPVGFARSQLFCCNPEFVIMDANRKTIFKIEGPFMLCRCCSDWDFDISAYDGNLKGAKVGRITKQWTGFVREAFTDADNFGVSFPKDMDVREKAVLLGVLFLIDFMFFEQNQNKNHHH